MILVSAAKIASVMALTPPPESFVELEDWMRRGLPASSLRAVVERIARTPEELRHILLCVSPEVTALGHRRERLLPDESEKTGRLARIFAMAAYVWDSETDAREFLATPHVQLNGCTPLDASMTEVGARRVEELLAKLFFGISA